MIESLTRAMCRVFGHRWQHIPGGETRDSIAEVCLRCRENGWLIKT